MDAKISSPVIMDEKRDMSPSLPLRRNRPFATAIFCFAVIYMFWLFQPFAIHPLSVNDSAAVGGALSESTNVESAITADLVPLEAHIISKCPDTKDAMRLLILPVMQRVYDKVNFTLSYIGHPTSNDGVECKHGPEECMGNIIELCARKLYPDPKISLGFVMCLTRDYESIPQRALVEACALEHAIDFQALNECATRDDGAYGLDLLRTSVQRTADVGVTKSCTIRLNNEIYCIRDDEQWIDCPNGPGVNDLIIAIEKLRRQS